MTASMKIRTILVALFGVFFVACGGERTFDDDGVTQVVRDAGDSDVQTCHAFDGTQTCTCGFGQTCGSWQSGCECIGEIVDAGFRDGGPSAVRDAGSTTRDAGDTQPGRDGGSTARDAGSPPPRDGGVGPRRDGGPPPSGVPTYSGGACPTFHDRGQGPNTILSGGQNREFLLAIPPNRQNARVIFVWHWWMGQADWAMDWTGLSGLSGGDTFIVSPITGPGSGSQWTQSDVTLFDDVFACLYENYGIDPDRVFVTGHSMGALFISQLIQIRGQYIAGFVTMSGGISGTLTPPQWPLPGLVMWGGPTDTCCNGFSFVTRSQNLSSQLRQNGSFVMHCVGDFGHSLPPMPDVVFPFYDNHVRGQPSPWGGGLPPGLFPGWCHLP